MMADVSGVADYPVLLKNDKALFLVWNTAGEGLKAMSSDVF